MNRKVLTGLLLIVVGIFAISYSYFPRKERHSINVGSARLGEVEITEQRTNPLVIAIGSLALIVGVIFLLKRR